jgi:hypothetical protein
MPNGLLMSLLHEDNILYIALTSDFLILNNISKTCRTFHQALEKSIKRIKKCLRWKILIEYSLEQRFYVNSIRLIIGVTNFNINNGVIYEGNFEDIEPYISTGKMLLRTHIKPKKRGVRLCDSNSDIRKGYYYFEEVKVELGELAPIDQMEISNLTLPYNAYSMMELK